MTVLGAAGTDPAATRPTVTHKPDVEWSSTTDADTWSGLRALNNTSTLPRTGVSKNLTPRPAAKIRASPMAATLATRAQRANGSFDVAGGDNAVAVITKLR